LFTSGQGVCSLTAALLVKGANVPIDYPRLVLLPPPFNQGGDDLTLGNVRKTPLEKLAALMLFDSAPYNSPSPVFFQGDDWGTCGLVNSKSRFANQDELINTVFRIGILTRRGSSGRVDMWWTGSEFTDRMMG
jgi:hypothetical protein